MTRIPSLDYMKLMMAIGVAYAHAILFQDLTKVAHYTVVWEFLVGNAVLRSFVPTFSVLSGYFLYITHKRGRARRWILELLVAYVFWIAFYLPIWGRDVAGWGDALWIVCFGPVHLWYVSGLILSGFVLVMLLRLCQRYGLGLWPIMVLAVVLALSGSAAAYWSFLGRHNIPLEVVRNGLTVVFPFAVVGYAIGRFVDARGREALPSARRLWTWTGVMFALKTAEAVFAMRYGLTASTLPELPLMAYPAAILLFLSFLRTDLPASRQNLSLWSVSIYFLHIFVFVVLHRFGVENIAVSVLAGTLIPIALALGYERITMRTSRRSTRERVADKPS